MNILTIRGFARTTVLLARADLSQKLHCLLSDCRIRAFCRLTQVRRGAEAISRPGEKIAEIQLGVSGGRVYPDSRLEFDSRPSRLGFAHEKIPQRSCASAEFGSA